VKELDPDFLVFPTYKWLLGPYSLAFLYAAPRWQDGHPIEQTIAGRRGHDPASTIRADKLDYAEGARRFDMGERDSSITIPMSSAGLECVLGWGVDAIAERARYVSEIIEAELPDLGLGLRTPRRRAPHILGVRSERPFPSDLLQQLALQNVFVSIRQGVLRVSTHIYNTDEDASKFLTAVSTILRRT
jgi:selenocysteine lyase/cysteine desulfurase